MKEIEGVTNKESKIIETVILIIIIIVLVFGLLALKKSDTKKEKYIISPKTINK